MSSKERKRKIAVVAFGGNALIKSKERGTIKEQWQNAEEAAMVLMSIIKNGYEMVVVHGNGPQVGAALIRQEAASANVPPQTLDACVAETQGSMGYLLQVSIRNRMVYENLEKPVCTILTTVVVDSADPAFHNPTKPIGPFFTRDRAEVLMSENGYKMIEDSGRGYRRVVPSPKPLSILEIDIIKHLVETGNIVIAGGGGGIPVYKDGLRYKGIASLIARNVRADLFIILTEVSCVYKNFGKPDQKAIDTLTLIEAIDLYREGQFPKGSMGPKIEASIDFLMNGGEEALITNAASLPEAVERKAGTRIIKNTRFGFLDNK
ncbi:MAG: carbamate kinase [Myxococcota bacterium]